MAPADAGKSSFQKEEEEAPPRETEIKKSQKFDFNQNWDFFAYRAQTHNSQSGKPTAGGGFFNDGFDDDLEISPNLERY